jgi:hypothetical protein
MLLFHLEELFQVFNRVFLLEINIFFTGQNQKLNDYSISQILVVIYNPLFSTGIVN